MTNNQSKNKIISIVMAALLVISVAVTGLSLDLPAYAAPTELVLDITGHTRLDINASTYEWNGTPIQSFDPSNDVIVLTGTGDCAIYLYLT